ncbi:protein transport protein yos1-like [Vicia villosa]|uniref:protein transport protein yos1-like n=1 Tax=Vicia villosa TaxID=3911 RepID=UPI00273C6B87|nr:protein transport protein yos1-like [Vicia villosa]XP_058729160.1 protein transport protein yos1-like [Vicia villosa]XP_058729161.1 protein transport protein yos1-like [Vicia villosa]XP_058729166.1 protein transport protein yos1-like [Vicia villosa]
MGFWLVLWTWLEGFLLFANALAILNEDRFLARRGWTLAEMTGPQRNTLKGQVIGLIHVCQYMRLPLIFFNILVITKKLIAG